MNYYGCETVLFHRKCLQKIFLKTYFSTCIKDGIGIEDVVTECEAFRCYNNYAVPSFRANTSCSMKTDGFFSAFSKHIYIYVSIYSNFKIFKRIIKNHLDFFSFIWQSADINGLL